MLRDGNVRLTREQDKLRSEIDETNGRFMKRVDVLETLMRDRKKENENLANENRRLRDELGEYIREQRKEIHLIGDENARGWAGTFLPKPGIRTQSGYGGSFPAVGRLDIGDRGPRVDTKGIDKCQEITIGKEPGATDVNIWLGEVAASTRGAYVYNGDYGYDMVMGVREMKDEEIDKPLIYPALEYQLYSALRKSARSEGLRSKLTIKALEYQQKGDRRMMTAMRCLKTIVKYIEIPRSLEHGMLMQALVNTAYKIRPGKSEEETLEEFMTRRDLIVAQLLASKGNTLSDNQIGEVLFAKVKGLIALNHDVERWRQSNEAERTHSWLREKIEARLEIWRAEGNSRTAAARAIERAHASGYIAMPATGPSRGPVEKVPPSLREKFPTEEIEQRTKREGSPHAELAGAGNRQDFG